MFTLYVYWHMRHLDYIDCTHVCLFHIFFFSSSNLILTVLEMMIMKGMITDCAGDFLLFELFFSIGLFRRYAGMQFELCAVLVLASSYYDK